MFEALDSHETGTLVEQATGGQNGKLLEGVKFTEKEQAIYDLMNKPENKGKSTRELAPIIKLQHETFMYHYRNIRRKVEGKTAEIEKLRKRRADRDYKRRQRAKKKEEQELKAKKSGEETGWGKKKKKKTNTNIGRKNNILTPGEDRLYRALKAANSKITLRDASAKAGISFKSAGTYVTKIRRLHPEVDYIRITTTGGRKKVKGDITTLTPLMQRVYPLMTKGLTYHEVAKQLKVANTTVYGYAVGFKKHKLPINMITKSGRATKHISNELVPTKGGIKTSKKYHHQPGLVNSDIPGAGQLSYVNITLGDLGPVVHIAAAREVYIVDKNIKII